MTRPKLFFIGSLPQEQKPYHYKECGLDNVYLTNGFSFDELDGETYVSIKNVDGLWKAIGMNLVTRQKTLSPSEIRFLRGQINMTQSELAGYLRVDDQTVARWEKNKTKLPGPADLGIRVLFLLSDVAQPEGKEYVAKFREMIKDLVEQDDPVTGEMHFVQHSSVWETQRVLVPAYAC